MDFQETLVVALPELGRLAEFAEHRSPLDKGIVIEVAAIHEGMTQNFNNYPATELAAALPTWTSPYPKPVLLHHDPYSEAVGRVVGSRMDKEEDGTPYVRLQVAITAPEAIQRVRDQRYLTGSVGGKAGKALCSVCQSDWSQASMFDLPCKHRRGKSYNGKIASIEMADISFKEYSFVNMPADPKSGVRAVHTPMESEEDFRPARFFCLDMVHEGITELGESERSVLTGLPTQQATSLYLGLKSAFLSAVYEDSRQAKEEGMGVKPGETVETPPEVEEEDDVLAVSETLSDALASTTESEEELEEGDADDTEGQDEEEEESEEGDEEESDGDAEEEEEGEEEESAEEPTASDGAGDTGDADTSSSDGTPEGETTAPAEGDHTHSVSTPTPTFTVTSGNTTYTTTGYVTGSSGSGGTITILPDPKVAELEQKLAAAAEAETKLKDENTRLRAALKRGLAERAVDMKIALALCENEEREVQLEEHMKRSASSLADSIRDMAAMVPQQLSLRQLPVVQPTIAAITGDENREPIAGSTTTSPKPDDPEDLFVDVLMGRRSL
jgi:hypothetical protein